MRGNSEQLVVQIPGDAITILLRMLPEYEQNYYPLLQLLSNNSANIMENYAKSCSSWTHDTFNRLVAWSLPLPLLHQSVILHGQCIDTVPFRQFAIARLLALGLGGVLSKTAIGSAGRFFNVDTIKNFSNWCERFLNLVMTKHIISTLDLPSIITTECLTKDYPNKMRLLGALNEQLKTSAHRSLTELLLKFRVISHKQLYDLRSTLREHTCSSTPVTFFHTLNTHLVGCPWPRPYAYDSSFFEELLSLDNVSLIIGLRAILAVYDQDMALDIVGGLAPIRLCGSSNLSSLCEDLFHIPLEHRRQFMAYLGIDYDSYMLRMSYSFWTARPDMIKKLPLRWRFQWYAKWHIKPALSNIGNFTQKISQMLPLRHLAGLEITADRIVRHLFKLVSNPENFAQTGLSVFRPRVWLSTARLEHFLGALVYATARFKKLFVVLDRSYCEMLQSKTPAPSLYYQHDFAMRPFQPIDEFMKTAQTNVQAQGQALSRIESNWKLLDIINVEDVCQLLAV